MKKKKCHAAETKSMTNDFFFLCFFPLYLPKMMTESFLKKKNDFFFFYMKKKKKSISFTYVISFKPEIFFKNSI